MAVTVPTEGPDELVLRVQDLQARLASSGDPATRHVAEELVSAVVQMYGGGLERIVELLHAGGEEGERVAAALGDDPLVATLLLIHDLHPVPLDVRVHQALEQRAAVHGVARRERRAALAGGRRGPDPARGQLLGLLRLGGDARARDQAGARAVGARPGWARGRGRRRARAAGRERRRAPGVDRERRRAAARSPTWVELDRLDVPAGELVAADVAGARSSSPTSTARCSPIATPVRRAAVPLHGGELQQGALRCPECARTFFLPRAGPLDGRRAPPARARAAAA